MCTGVSGVQSLRGPCFMLVFCSWCLCWRASLCGIYWGVQGSLWSSHTLSNKKPRAHRSARGLGALVVILCHICPGVLVVNLWRVRWRDWGSSWSACAVCAKVSRGPSYQLATYELKGPRALVVSCMCQEACRPQPSAWDIYKLNGLRALVVNLHCMCQGALVVTFNFKMQQRHYWTSWPKALKDPRNLIPQGTITSLQVYTPALTMEHTVRANITMCIYVLQCLLISVIVS